MKVIGFRDFRDGNTNAETQKEKSVAQAPKEPMHKLKGVKVQNGPSASKRIDERYHVVTSKYSLEPGEVGKRTSEDEVHSKHKSLKAAAKKLTTVIRTKRDANKYEILDTETGKRMSRNQARDLGEEQLDELVGKGKLGDMVNKYDADATYHLRAGVAGSRPGKGYKGKIASAKHFHDSEKAVKKKWRGMELYNKATGKRHDLDTTGKALDDFEAKYSKKKVSEENINEISKELAGRYVKKSMEDAYGRGFNKGIDVFAKTAKRKPEEIAKDDHKTGNRFVGVHRAVKRLTKD